MKLIDHIGIWENLIPEDLCKQFIKMFDKYTSNKMMNFQNPSLNSETYADKKTAIGLQLGNKQYTSQKNGRNDVQLFLNLIDNPLVRDCYSALQYTFDEYSNEYSELKNVPLSSPDVKMQRIPPGGGYHIWHSERLGSSMVTNARHIVWMIYLNNMPEGEAETEFMYQKLRIKPTVGTVVMWPASYTHLHRGNPPYTQDKYILTGWFRSVYQEWTPNQRDTQI